MKPSIKLNWKQYKKKYLKLNQYAFLRPVSKGIMMQEVFCMFFYDLFITGVAIQWLSQKTRFISKSRPIHTSVNPFFFFF